MQSYLIIFMLHIIIHELLHQNLEGNHPDYTIFKVIHHPFKLQIHAIVELKSKAGVSWNQLLEQMYSQADVAKIPKVGYGLLVKRVLKFVFLDLMY